MIMMPLQYKEGDFSDDSGHSHVSHRCVPAEGPAQAQAKFHELLGLTVAAAIQLIPCFHECDGRRYGEAPR
jgi:hypothetical protein